MSIGDWDPNAMPGLTTTTGGGFVQHYGPCPTCGHCPTCGRRYAQPFTVTPYWWQQYEYPGIDAAPQWWNVPGYEGSTITINGDPTFNTTGCE